MKNAKHLKDAEDHLKKHQYKLRLQQRWERKNKEKRDSSQRTVKKWPIFYLQNNGTTLELKNKENPQKIEVAAHAAVSTESGSTLTGNLELLFTNADVLTRDKLMELECRLGSLETTPHVIMISEVKPKYYRRTLTPTEYKLDQYEMIHKNLTTDIGRGLCTYIRKGVEYREVNINSSFEEFLAVEIKLNNNNKKKLIINVYRRGSCEEGTMTVLTNCW